MTLALAAAGLGAVLFAILTVFQRNLYASALCLLAVLLKVAAIFFLLGAQLLGFLQILVYAGAVMVLIVVAVMSSPVRISSPWSDFKLPVWLVSLVLAAPLLELLLAATLSGGNAPLPPAVPALERAMAGVLFGRFALMTEAVGLAVLIVSMALLQER